MFELGSPFRRGNNLFGKLVGGIANGWAISGITTWQSGPNLNIGLSLTSTAGFTSNRMWLGTPDIPIRPIAICDPTKGLRDRQFVNGACFAVPARGQAGQFQLPYIHGPAYFNNDMTVSKTFSVTERQKVQLKLTALNWLNHPLVSYLANGESNLTLQFTENPNAPGQWTQTNQNFGMATVKYGRRVVALTLNYSF
jgi:hypothetical protein